MPESPPQARPRWRGILTLAVVLAVPGVALASPAASAMAAVAEEVLRALR